MALGSSFVEQFCRIQALGQYSWRNASGNIFAEQHWGQLWPAFRISFEAARGITNGIFGSIFGTRISVNFGGGGGLYMWGGVETNIDDQISSNQRAWVRFRK
jgi:hypothetical protein